MQYIWIFIHLRLFTSCIVHLIRDCPARLKHTKILFQPSGSNSPLNLTKALLSDNNCIMDIRPQYCLHVQFFRIRYKFDQDADYRFSSVKRNEILNSGINQEHHLQVGHSLNRFQIVFLIFLQKLKLPSTLCMAWFLFHHSMFFFVTLHDF